MQHVLKRLYQRFDLSLTEDDYSVINNIAENTKPTSASSKDINCDYREITFRNLKMVCVFDNYLKKIRTVLHPVERDNDTLLKGQIFTGTIVNNDTIGGYIVLLQNKYPAILPKDQINENIHIGHNLYFRVLHNSENKKNGQRKIFVKIAKMIDYIPKNF